MNPTPMMIYAEMMMPMQATTMLILSDGYKVDSHRISLCVKYTFVGIQGGRKFKGTHGEFFLLWGKWCNSGSGWGSSEYLNKACVARSISCIFSFGVFCYSGYEIVTFLTHGTHFYVLSNTIHPGGTTRYPCYLIRKIFVGNNFSRQKFSSV